MTTVFITDTKQADILRALINLCGVNGWDMIPLAPRKFMELFEEAQKHGTKALFV
ncbi:MAG: hypothetical protein ACTSPS_05495 [Promethearchaeota archaeon]